MAWRPTRPRRTATVLVALLVLVLTACGADDGPDAVNEPTDTVPRRDRVSEIERRPEGDCGVLLVGDSLTVDSEIDAGYPDCWVVSARDGRYTQTGVEVITTLGPERFSTVVVALGTNDGRDQTAVFRTTVDEVVEVIGEDTRVVWVNVDTQSPQLQSLERLNGVLDDAEGRYDNLEVADWDDEMIRQDGGAHLREDDQIHYTVDGSRHRRDWVVEQVRSDADDDGIDGS